MEVECVSGHARAIGIRIPRAGRSDVFEDWRNDTSTRTHITESAGDIVIHFLGAMLRCGGWRGGSWNPNWRDIFR